MDSYWQSAKREVRFSETDASGRVHFTEILKYVEDAEHAFLRERGIEVMGENTGWPRVAIQCDYRAALAFGDALKVVLARPEVKRSSLRWQFQVVMATEEAQLIAQGEMTTVQVNGEGKAVEISTEDRKRLLGE